MVESKSLQDSPKLKSPPTFVPSSTLTTSTASAIVNAMNASPGRSSGFSGKAYVEVGVWSFLILFVWAD